MTERLNRVAEICQQDGCQLVSGVGADVGAVIETHVRVFLSDLRFRRDGKGHTSADLDWVIRRLEAALGVGADVGADAPASPSKQV